MLIHIAIQLCTPYVSSRKSYDSFNKMTFIHLRDPAGNRLKFAGYRSSRGTLFSRRAGHKRSKDYSKYPGRSIHPNDRKHFSGPLRCLRNFSHGVAIILERCTRRSLFTFCLLPFQSSSLGMSSDVFFSFFCLKKKWQICVLFLYLMQIPGYVIETFVFVSIAYWLMGLKPEAGAFLYSCWILMVTCNTAAACG